MRNIAIIIEILPRAEVHVSIYLPGVGTDYRSICSPGYFHRQPGLSGGGGAKNHDEVGRGFHTTNLVHFSEEPLLATTLSMNAIPRTPSSTCGKSSISAVGVSPLSLAETVSAKLR